MPIEKELDSTVFHIVRTLYTNHYDFINVYQYLFFLK